ncbi:MULTISPECIES: siderophore ABC transporter substrate-binding protein [unclassified Sporosarcina]|uniref:siderophore ABC transporter substrate-binding protein n=1 Tax=unclassified Sporosarcina TaxID=2647733 RepID=UPI00203A5FE6|nr:MULTISPECIES: siderophore ABC transporter substrate-binding protein [unclassified Sporosarcina]GKV65423.1 putative ABC transporter solute-binding protein YclQ [Sporosarcina sp. NCCP-2331]GLB55547.1 putative ABC transporter solute-binding protein YclQ [Sporosarcina sp. NCCP-2378]
MKKLTLSLFALILMLALAACGNTKEEDKPADNAASEDKPAAEESAEKTDSTEITIEHELGETTLEKNPEKVVVFDFGVLDTLDELGIEVAGLPQANIPGYLSKYEDEKYENLGSLKEPDFEAINAMKPDVIFISGRQSDSYEELSKIAPTIFMGVDTARYMDSFKENMEKIATIFDKEDEMNTELADVDASIEEIKAKTAESDSKALMILATEGKISAYGPSSRFGIIHDVFGFEPADEKIEASTHGQNITFEYILDTNPDILFIIDRDASIGNGASAKDSVENDLVKKTNAFKNDKMIYLNGEYWYLSGGGLQSVKEMIKEVEVAL